jgi:hypothetical protein
MVAAPDAEGCPWTFTSLRSFNLDGKELEPFPRFYQSFLKNEKTGHRTEVAFEFRTATPRSVLWSALACALDPDTGDRRRGSETRSAVCLRLSPRTLLVIIKRWRTSSATLRCGASACERLSHSSSAARSAGSAGWSCSSVPGVTVRPTAGSSTPPPMTPPYAP